MRNIRYLCEERWMWLVQGRGKRGWARATPMVLRKSTFAVEGLLAQLSEFPREDKSLTPCFLLVLLEGRGLSVTGFCCFLSSSYKSKGDWQEISSSCLCPQNPRSWGRRMVTWGSGWDPVSNNKQHRKRMVTSLYWIQLFFKQCR